MSQEKVLKFLNFSYFRVASESMYDSLKIDDYVIVKTISEKECYNLKPSKTLNSKDGDVIIFKLDKNKFPDILVIHRVVENDLKNRYVTTKGDNNQNIEEFDRFINYNNILAKPIFKIDHKYIFLIKCAIVIYFCFFIIYFLIKKLKLLMY
ncbi:S26 family signal peptidase ['Cynodon dactylon' phytoplasma]|uniref:S26 family signal peptidase n=1 Tax='Cynodon dactylon' phytoplasma TaxID=295320 RepID=UPI00186B1992|nr:S26 family signal peptidase ['Cynodon dactylon' phytoplasma]